MGSTLLLKHIMQEGNGLIEGNGEIGLKAASVYRIHIVCCALVKAGIHLSSRINFDLRLDAIIANGPFVHVHIQMLIDFCAVLVPGYVRARIALGHAQKGDLVAQHVLEIKVRGLQDFGALLPQRD